MPTDAATRHLIDFAGNQGRLFAAAAIAGKLAAMLRLRIPVSGIIVEIPNRLQVANITIPLVSSLPCPVGLMCAEPDNPVAAFCAVQGASIVATGRTVALDDTSQEISEAFTIALKLIDDFGRDRLVALTKVLLEPPYDVPGIWPIPGRVTRVIALPHDDRGDTHDATQRLRQPPKNAGKPYGVSHDES